MLNTSIQDRASGPIMGAFIGDALALGPHWYYNLAELRKDYGDWIDDYTDPKPGRYHDGLKAGQLSQAGFILALMLRSLVDCGEYDEEDFCRRMDEELFPLLDCSPVSLNRPARVALLHLTPCLRLLLWLLPLRILKSVSNRPGR